MKIWNQELLLDQDLKKLTNKNFYDLHIKYNVNGDSYSIITNRFEVDVDLPEIKNVSIPWGELISQYDIQNVNSKKVTFDTVNINDGNLCKLTIHYKNIQDTLRTYESSVESNSCEIIIPINDIITLKVVENILLKLLQQMELEMSHYHFYMIFLLTILFLILFVVGAIL